MQSFDDFLLYRIRYISHHRRVFTHQQLHLRGGQQAPITTDSATSASSNAMLTSRSASAMLSSVNRALPVICLRLWESRSERLSNINPQCSFSCHSLGLKSIARDDKAAVITADPAGQQLRHEQVSARVGDIDVELIQWFGRAVFHDLATMLAL